MKFATCMGLFLKERLGDDHFRQIRAHGFDTVELCIYPGHFQGTDEEEVRLKKSLKEHRINVHSMHCSFNALTGERLTYETLSGSLADIAVLNDRLSRLWEDVC